MNTAIQRFDPNTVRSQFAIAIKSGLMPKGMTQEQAVVLAMQGNDLGLTWTQSIRAINVIQGKPTISSELMRALVFQRLPRAEMTFTETGPTKCTVKARRAEGQDYTSLMFTVDDAKRAGLMEKDTWKKYPAAMLQARVTSMICRLIFSDVILGFYTPDELGAMETP